MITEKNWWLGKVHNKVATVPTTRLFISSKPAFTEEELILYKAYGFELDENKPQMTLDLDEVLEDSRQNQRLNDTIKVLIKQIGDIKDEMLVRDRETIAKMRQYEGKLKETQKK